jgi:hypothetical protein
MEALRLGPLDVDNRTESGMARRERAGWRMQVVDSSNLTNVIEFANPADEFAQTLLRHAANQSRKDAGAVLRKGAADRPAQGYAKSNLAATRPFSNSAKRALPPPSSSLF